MQAIRCSLWACLVVAMTFLLGGAGPDGEQHPAVLVIGIDGCRPDGIEAARTPALDRLIKGGIFVRASCLPPRPTIADSVSGPGWAAIVTGVWAEKHGIRDNSFRGSRIDHFPHFFARLRASGFQGKLASVVHWEPIRSQLVRGTADVDEAYGSDDQVADRAVALLEDEQLRVLFLHFDDADHAGHTYGFDPDLEQYRAAIEAIDRRVGRILAGLDRRVRNRQENWLVLVTSDHGGSGKSHGGGARDVERRTSFIIASGQAFRGRQLTRPASLPDVAATALYHLLGRIDPEWQLDGRPLQLDLKPAE